MAGLIKNFEGKIEMHYSATSLHQGSPILRGKVAVIVPVFNLQRCVAECIDSVIKQTYRNFVLIAVNDGSSDRSLEILESYRKKDNRVIVINQENKGSPNARNAGLEVAENIKDVEYIAFVDGDDFIDVNFLAVHVENLAKKQADVSICGYVTFGDVQKNIEKKFLKKRILTQFDFLKMVFSNGEWKYTHGVGGMVWKQVYRLSVIKGVRFYDDREMVEDEFFCVKISRLAKVYVYIPQNLYHYRVSAGTLTKQKNFLKQLVVGRRLCYEISVDFPESVREVIFCSYLKSLLELMKRSDEICDLHKYKNYVNELRRRKIIDWRMMKRFLMFCYMPNIAKKMYSIDKCFRNGRNYVMSFIWRGK